MSKGYKEKLNWKEIAQDKLQILKHKNVKFSSFLCLGILNIAIILTFSILFTNYQQQHPYTLDEVASLTDSLAYQWYNETTTELSSDVTQEDSDTSEIIITTTIQELQTEMTTEDEQNNEETSTQEDTTNEVETAVEETTAPETTSIQTTTATTTAFAAYSTSLSADTLVYVTASGSKFHYVTCSYLSSSCSSLSYSQAISQGYSPCSRCFPNG